MSGWNLPDGCSQSDVDRAMGDYYEECDLDDLADELYDRDVQDELDGQDAT